MKNTIPSSGSRRTRRKSRTDGNHAHVSDRWLISYADLVTLLFALFVVLYAAADQDRAQAIWRMHWPKNFMMRRQISLTKRTLAMAFFQTPAF
ncbi:MAG: flagellar motor protein MotB [Pyrinomonadaceae bacterium]